MSNIAIRLGEYMVSLGYTANYFARHIGIDQANLSKMLKERQKITDKTLNKVRESCPDLNMAWLLTGEGEMLKTDSSKHSIHTIHQQNNDNANGVIQVSDNINNNNKDEMPIDNSNSNEVFLRKVIDRLMDTQERICMELKDIRMALEQQSAKLRELEASLGRDKAHAYHQQHQDTEQEEMKGVG